MSDDCNKDFDETLCNWARIIEAMFVAPKTYAVTYLDTNKKAQTKVRCKGVPKSAPISIILTKDRVKGAERMLITNEVKTFQKFPRLSYEAMRCWLHEFSKVARDETEKREVLLKCEYENIHRINIHESTAKELLPMTLVDLKMERKVKPNSWVNRPTLGNIRLPFTLVNALNAYLLGEEKYDDWTMLKEYSRTEAPSWLSNVQTRKRKREQKEMPGMTMKDPDMFGEHRDAPSFADYFAVEADTSFRTSDLLSVKDILAHVEDETGRTDHFSSKCYCGLSSAEFGKIKNGLPISWEQARKALEEESQVEEQKLDQPI